MVCNLPEIESLLYIAAPFSWVHILRSRESEFKVGLQSMDVTEQCRA